MHADVECAIGLGAGRSMCAFDVYPHAFNGSESSKPITLPEIVRASRRLMRSIKEAGIRNNNEETISVFMIFCLRLKPFYKLPSRYL
jgi:hypothetical protein